jgi:hypothetical protein
LADSILYVLVSDSADDAAVNLHDQATEVQITLTLPAEHAAIALIRRKEKEKRIVAKYGF